MEEIFQRGHRPDFDAVGFFADAPQFREMGAIDYVFGKINGSVGQRAALDHQIGTARHHLIIAAIEKF
jgi:hypothetical protein